jgi:hypothetical protein
MKKDNLWGWLWSIPSIRNWLLIPFLSFLCLAVFGRLKGRPSPGEAIVIAWAGVCAWRMASTWFRRADPMADQVRRGAKEASAQEVAGSIKEPARISLAGVPTPLENERRCHIYK